MNKAILVLEEMPKTCFDCPLRKEYELAYIGNYTYKQYYRCGVRLMEGEFILEDIAHEKPEWCPLKSVPKKLDRLENEMNTDTGYRCGWNDCIDEIVKER